ncbi:MAG: hypothetical protein HC929_03320 [Leptolyngbyaceae cyanobacterium SM2_5_2]|nr:hypothetical protein [Leptolyngbyaceae cyanobacterium SM2_5_2]
MLEVEKIGALAQAYSPQELMAALVWQRRFNRFDGSVVITDLAQQPHLRTGSFASTLPCGSKGVKNVPGSNDRCGLFFRHVQPF